MSAAYLKQMSRRATYVYREGMAVLKLSDMVNNGQRKTMTPLSPSARSPLSPARLVQH